LHSSQLVNEVIKITHKPQSFREEPTNKKADLKFTLRVLGSAFFYISSLAACSWQCGHFLEYNVVTFSSSKCSIVVSHVWQMITPIRSISLHILKAFSFISVYYYVTIGLSTLLV
jgi:hypothetical protein